MGKSFKDLFQRLKWRKSQSAPPRRWGWRRILRILAIVIVVLIAIPLILVPVYRFVPPPFTTVMVQNLWQDGWPRREWVPLDEISRHLQYAVVMSEDGRFCEHNGIDWRQVQIVLRQWEEGREPRGASTITMQLAKNLFLPPMRSYIRKGFEVPLALYIELWWPKRRILEVYLNSVEFDAGVYGAEAAAQHYFRKSARNLTDVEGARLAAILPNPRGRDAANPSQRVRNMSARALARARQAGAYVRCLQP